MISMHSALERFLKKWWLTSHCNPDAQHSIQGVSKIMHEFGGGGGVSTLPSSSGLNDNKRACTNWKNKLTYKKWKAACSI